MTYIFVSFSLILVFSLSKVYTPALCTPAFHNILYKTSITNKKISAIMKFTIIINYVNSMTQNNYKNIVKLNFVQEKSNKNKRQSNVNLVSQLKENLEAIRNGIR